MKNKTVVPRLSSMMFLQYAAWGAWLPVAARYLTAPVAEGGLGFNGGQVGMILGLAGSIGAIGSPFIAGQLADRWFSTERFLAFLLLVGSAIQWTLSEQTSYGAWLVLAVLYSLVYMPTLALSNSLAFAHLTDRTRQFPKVRVWGTIGWIAASWIFPMIWLQTDLRLQAMPPFVVGPEVPHVTARLADALKFSGLISLGYAAFSLLLPHTPPKKGAVESLAFAKAFRLLGNRSFAVLVAASLPISIIHQIYFLQAGPYLAFCGLKDSEIGPAMTVGQFSEIAIMAGLGWMLRRLGPRNVITIGALAYFVRYLIWSTTGLPVELTVASLTIHGICYACFFASAFIYVDRLAPPDVRHSAQTVFGILILGGGPVLGGWLSGFLSERYTTGGALDYSALWLTLSAIGLATAVLFFALFRAQVEAPAQAAAEVQT